MASSMEITASVDGGRSWFWLVEGDVGWFWLIDGEVGFSQ